MDIAHQTLDTTEDNVYNRTFFVLDRMVELIPTEAQNHPIAQMITFMVREGKRDVRRISADFITELAREVGAAFTWVANGSMDDLTNGESDELLDIEIPEDDELMVNEY